MTIARHLTKPTETLVVGFEDLHHKSLHQVLLDAGFNFQVTSELRIGRHYVHPKKPIEVALEDGEEDAPWLDCKVFYRGNVQTASDYSEAEWNWMTYGPDSPETTIEMLRRELHVLIFIRPRYMTRAQIEHSIAST